VRGNGKELKEAKRFLEAFGIDDDESVDAVRRCSNMLREAKGNGKIGGYLLYGNTSGEIEGEEMRTTVEFCAQLSCGGAVGPHEGGRGNEMTLFRRYKSLLHRPHRKINRLHLRNNPYQEVHLRSCDECP